jgi:uncharacterized protein
MYLVPIKVKKSSIDGQGVFACQDIPKGTKVWVYKDSHDLKYSKDEFEAFPTHKKELFHRIAYLSPWTGYWISPPPDDPACYTNHSSKNNTSVIFDSNISPEPYFVANRTIQAGEEITNNYYEFDKITQQTKPAWAK